MKVDKDKPKTWLKFKPSLCNTCIGTCCTMPVEVKFDDLLRLNKVTEDDRFESRKKLINRLKKSGLIQSYRESTQLFMLSQRANGDCVFLDAKTRLCTSYANRPETCRQFPSTLSLRPGFCPLIEKSLP